MIDDLDKNIFRGILNNNTFISVIATTLIGQILIVQFGGRVFTLDPSGLSLAGWGVSILVGSGSIIVGFVIRMFPPFKIPAVFLGAAEEEEEVKIAAYDASIEMEKLASYESAAVLLQGGSKRSSLVRVFVEPSSNKPPSIKTGTSLTGLDQIDKGKKVTSPAQQNWKNLRSYISVTNALRKPRKDFTSVHMVDPQKVYQARLQQAKSKV